MLPKYEFEIYQTVHSYAKIYPTMTKLFIFNQPSQIRVKGFEPQKRKKPTMHPNNEQDPVTLIDSLRRTKTRLSDIVVCNRFDLFCTFTFKDDRQNVDHCKTKMSTWLAHQQERVGKFEYLIVPEFHKDGKSIHFHALFKNYRGELVNTGHYTGKHQVSYEVKGYRLGWATAVKIKPEDIEKVGSYVKKYITKDMPQFNGKKRYWCSHGLVRPEKVTNPIVFPSDMQKFTEQHEMQNMTLHQSSERIHFVGAEPEQQKRTVLDHVQDHEN